MLVLQPLTQGLRSLNIYYRLYEDNKGVLNLKVGKTQFKLGEISKLTTGRTIIGSSATRGEILYKLYEDHFTKDRVLIKLNLSDAEISKIDKLVESCYNFEETHKVTEWN